MCLLHLLTKWREKLEVKLHIAHLDHQLRGAESEADARYVAELAGSLGIPVTIERQDVATYRTKRNCSIEEAARELRYDFLAEVANDIGANRVAIGHTRDDQVETVLMHILRGTGTSGLRGIEPCSLIPSKSRQLSAISYQILIVRPLLDITREETLNYCQEYQLEPRIDSSNLSLSFLRNRIRLELLPLLRKYNPKVDEALLRLAEIAKDDSSFMEQQVVGLWDEVTRQEGGVVYLDKGKFGALPVALQRQLLRLAVARILGDTRDIEINHIEAVRSLLSKSVGKRISLPHGIVCWTEYDEVVIAVSRSPERSEGEAKQAHLAQDKPCGEQSESIREESHRSGQAPRPKNLTRGKLPRGAAQQSYVLLPPLQGELSLKVPGETWLPGWRVIASIVPVIAQISSSIASRSPGCSEAYPPFVIAREAKQSHDAQGKLSEAISAEFDLHQTGMELFVRQRQPGDRFQPLGMNMPKKLQDFMVDAKIPLSWRDNIPIVCSPQQIIWVVGWRIDDRVKVAETTKEILRMEFIKLS